MKSTGVKFIAATGDPLDGWNIDLANIDAVIDTHRRTTPQAPEHEGGEDRPADYSHRSGNIPDWIIDLVRKPDAQDRSKEFFKVVCALKRRGWSPAEIEALFADNIDGIASKYWNRLRQEVDRAFDKESQRDIEASPEPDGADHAKGASEDEGFIREVRRLAALSDPAYERIRIQAAKKLGVRAVVLDKLRASERKEGCSVGQGKQLEFPAPVAWPEPVDGAELLDEIEATFQRFVVCEPAARVALALWSCGTWFEPVAQVAPILNIASPEMRCGKSTALSVTRKFVKRPLTAASISPAAVFRTIEKHAPTQADTFLRGNEELQGLINSGHTRDSAFVVRTVGDDHEPKRFATWGFKAIVGIGRRAATIEDRSITISLKRKLCGEKVERLRHANPGLFETLTRKLARFAEDNGKAVADARPHLPEALNDREQDNWELLIAIAEVAGGAWPQKAREAAIALSGVEEEPSHGAMLLADIREEFEARGEKEIASEALVAALNAMRDRPWGECNRGKALTQNLLARRLKPFGVSPKNVGPKHDRA